MPRKPESVNIDEGIRGTLASLGVKNFSAFTEQVLLEAIEELRGLKDREDKTMKAYQSRLAKLELEWDELQKKLGEHDGNGEGAGSSASG